ncbi:hypothetical protein QQF64_029425 [Cirrhinus molitorella]|uniref:Uncharacterized protein n=1 Tax=Cirrhinus molitorella TaxID=172907 RepID=A0ABR3N0L3_9TELE
MTAKAGLNLERAREGERNTVTVSRMLKMGLCLAAGQTRAAAAPEQTADKAPGSHLCCGSHHPLLRSQRAALLSPLLIHLDTDL